MAWSPNGKYIASGDEGGTVQVWDALTGTLQVTYTGHSDSITHLAWSPNSRYLATASGHWGQTPNDHTVQVWDAQTGRTLLTYRGHSASVWSVAWSPDGKRIASGSWDKTVQVWKAP